jgi:hypothetical protein
VDLQTEPRRLDLTHWPAYNKIVHSLSAAQKYEARTLGCVLSYLWDLSKALEDLVKAGKPASKEELQVISHTTTSIEKLILDRWSLLVIWAEHPNSLDLIRALERQLEGPVQGYQLPPTELSSLYAQLQRDQVQATLKAEAKKGINSDRTSRPRQDARQTGPKPPPGPGPRPPGAPSGSAPAAGSR